MTTISAEEARNQFADIINKAAYGHERTVVTRRGKRVAAIVSVEDLELLEAIVDELENRADAEYCRTALEKLDLSQLPRHPRTCSDHSQAQTADGRELVRGRNQQKQVTYDP